MSQDIVRTKPAEWLMDDCALTQLINWAAGRKGNEKAKAVLRNELNAVAAGLAGPSPSPVESMLADAAATSWFAFRLHEAQYAGAINSNGMTVAQSEHAQRRMDRAHRRFLTTVV